MSGIGASTAWIYGLLLIIRGPFFLEWSVGDNNLSLSPYFNIECVLESEPAEHIVMNPLISHVFDELLNGHFNFLSYIILSIRSTWICSSFDNALNVATLFPFLTFTFDLAAMTCSFKQSGQVVTVQCLVTV